MRLRSERGQVMPIVGLCLLVFLGMAAFAIDIGNAYLHQKRLKSAVDLALVSAAQKLPDATAASADAKSYVDRNWAKQDTTAVASTATASCMVAGCTQKDKVSIEASADVPTYFAKLFGKDSFKVHAKGAACGPCDAQAEKFDVMVILDRSNSMCQDTNGNTNSYTVGGVLKCPDLENAKEGIRSLLRFFNPLTDRVGFAVLTAGDSNAPIRNTGYPCDTSPLSYPQGKPFAAGLGDFVEGTAADHDKWVIANLAYDYKKTDGSLNTASTMVSSLDCLRGKGHTAMAPAVKEATAHMLANSRAGAKKFMVFMGDGGGNTQPVVRQSDGTPTTTLSWYTPSSGNNLKPCADAVAQAGTAKANGIEVFTIGYDLSASGGAVNNCYKNNKPGSSSDLETLTARETLRQMASDNAHFYEKADPGEVYTIFNNIGRKITGSGIRIVE